MSTELRNVPNAGNTNDKLTQTRFWGGPTRKTCLQVTQRGQHSGFDFLQLTRAQAGASAVELMLFAASREVESGEVVELDTEFS
jgi:hypothetical protein